MNNRIAFAILFLSAALFSAAQSDATFTVKKAVKQNFISAVYFSNKYFYREKFVQVMEDSAGNKYFSPLYYSSHTVTQADSICDIFMFDSNGIVQYFYYDLPEGKLEREIIQKVDTAIYTSRSTYSISGDTLRFSFPVLGTVMANWMYSSCTRVDFIGIRKSGELQLTEQSVCGADSRRRSFRLKLLKQ